MELFGIGPGELMIILVLALIIVGPQKLPELGRNLGRTVGEFKAQTDQMRSVLNFDTLTAPSAAPATAPVARSERDTQALLHTDERVLALQAYGTTAVAAVELNETTVITPAAQSAAQEPAA